MVKMLDCLFNIQTMSEWEISKPQTDNVFVICWLALVYRICTNKFPCHDVCSHKLFGITLNLLVFKTTLQQSACPVITTDRILLWPRNLHRHSWLFVFFFISSYKTYKFTITEHPAHRQVSIKSSEKKDYPMKDCSLHFHPVTFHHTAHFKICHLVNKLFK